MSGCQSVFSHHLYLKIKKVLVGGGGGWRSGWSRGVLTRTVCKTRCCSQKGRVVMATDISWTNDAQKSIYTTEYIFFLGGKEYLLVVIILPIFLCRATSWFIISKVFRISRISILKFTYNWEFCIYPIIFDRMLVQYSCSWNRNVTT